MTTDTNKLEQGDIRTLFPNLGMKIIANGCVCGIIGVYPQQLKVIILETFEGSMYKVNSQIWVDSFLIEKI